MSTAFNIADLPDGHLFELNRLLKRTKRLKVLVVMLGLYFVLCALNTYPILLDFFVIWVGLLYCPSTAKKAWSAFWLSAYGIYLKFAYHASKQEDGWRTLKHSYIKRLRLRACALTATPSGLRPLTAGG